MSFSFLRRWLYVEKANVDLAVMLLYPWIRGKVSGSTGHESE